MEEDVVAFLCEQHAYKDLLFILALAYHVGAQFVARFGIGEINCAPTSYTVLFVKPQQRVLVS
jgi:hypothetical protein